MPIGCITNVLSVLIGSLLGALIGKKMPEKLKVTLPMIFAVISLSMAITLLIVVKNLSAVALAMIVGAIIGEMLDLEGRIRRVSVKLQNRLSSGSDADPAIMEQFISMLVLFCFSGTGIFGALNEGFCGESSVLILKSVLDLFTALIFAANIGYLMAFIPIPQTIVYAALFFGAGLIMPLINETMLCDFKACGGVVTLCVAIRLLDIKPMRVINLLPALVLVMPISYLWSML